MLKNSKIQFENPELKKIVFYENLNFNTEKYDGMKLIGNTKIKRRINNNSAIVNFRLNIGEDNDKFPFYCVLEMESVFQWEKDIDDHFVEELLKTNASSLLLGYMRPIVANVTEMTKYPSFNIPFLDMSENEAEISWSE